MPFSFGTREKIFNDIEMDVDKEDFGKLSVDGIT
jgi:hypothetical protein